MVESTQTSIQNIKFLRQTSNAATIAPAVQYPVDLHVAQQQFGQNFNTLVILNTDSATNMDLYLDGQKVVTIPANNGSFGFDWQFGLEYNNLYLINADAAATTAANAIKVTYGRSGV